mgnify:CR=1 FL=1
MASRTQIRLQQLTGSLVDLKTEAQQYGTPATAAALTGSDLQDVLGAFGAALNRIHGAASDEPFNAAGGQFLNAATTDGTDGAGAILLSAANGGIGIAFANNKDLWIEGGQTMIVAEHDTANAIKLHADAGASQTIAVLNDEGTDEAAIALTSTAGGVDIDAAANKDVNIAGGQVLLVSKENAASAIALTADVGATETIVVTNTQGTGEGAIALVSTAGGVDIDAAATKNIDISGGQVLISSKEDAASAIALTANVGTNETIIITNTQGTDAAAISLLASAGGITIDGENAVSIKENGAEVIGITDDRAVNIGVSGQATTVKGTFNVDEAASFDNNVTITGNLDINGTTTTVDTVNLSIQDSIIALGVSGSDGGYSTVGDRGILFPRGADSSAVAGFFFDGTNFNLGSSLTGPTSGSFETVAAADYSTLKLGNLLPGADDTYDLGSSSLAWKDLHLEGDILLTDAGKVETTAGDLTISSAAGQVVLDAETDIVLDANGADVFLKDNGQIFSSLTNGSNNALVLSGGFDGGNIHLDSNGGVFALQAGGLNMNAIELESTGMKIGLFDGASGNFNAGFLQLKDSNGNPSILSGTVGLRLDSGAAAASIQLLTNNHDSNFVALKAPNSVGSPVTFTLPGADGTSNQALITNGSGTLSFKSFGSDAIRKGVFVQSATLSAGDDLQVSNVTPAHGDAIAIDNVSATQGRALDVYVNGQLLISGSSAARTANPPTVDYEIAAVSPQSILKFSFDLEADDVVQVIKRG